MKRISNRSISWLLLVLIAVPFIYGSKKTGKNSPFIIDYQDHLNKKFKKIQREHTVFIIVHTSEAGLESTLLTLSHGKDVGKYRTNGGHSNYAIARDGQVYRILNHPYRSDHAGLSMWDGIEDISSYSIGIELIGYHYADITPQQYSSLGRLLKILQRLYSIPDKNVLTHSQVSYGKPNPWNKRPHRGRKRCALNFEREKAGLKDAWENDPDVQLGRLAGDTHIYSMFYKKFANAQKKPAPVSVVIDVNPPTIEKTPLPTEPVYADSNIISKDNTAWNIAGEDYDDPSTLYALPDNRDIRGDQMEKTIGWDKIPTGTRVLLNQPMDIEAKKGPLLPITKEYTAWSYAQQKYKEPTTFYFMPDNRIIPGNEMSDWDNLPDGTQMIIGYSAPKMIQAAKGKTAWGLAGRSHNLPDTVYFIPGLGLRTGDQVLNFNDLPLGTSVFLPATVTATEKEKKNVK